MIPAHFFKFLENLDGSNFWKLYVGNFFGNYMLGNFWKLYAGNFLELYAEKCFGNYMLENFLEAICWKIRVDAGGFLKGVIMAQCYGIILRFTGMVPGAQLSIPAVQTFLERSEAKRAKL